MPTAQILSLVHTGQLSCEIPPVLTKFCYTTRNHLVDRKHPLVTWTTTNVFPKDVQHDTVQPANPLFLIYRVLLTTKSFARPPGSQAYLMRSRGVVNASNFWNLREKGVAREGGVPPYIWLLTT